MSELRKQLEHAARDYRSLRYPGDLAWELLNFRPGRRLRWTGMIAAGITALAAAVLIAVYLAPAPASHPNQSVAIVPANPDQHGSTAAPTTEQSTLTLAPTDFSLSISTFDLSPPAEGLSIPSLPLAPTQSALNSIPVEKTTTTTQESVS